MRFWFPYPLLSLALLMLWLLVNQSLSPAQILLGAVLGVSLAWAMVNLQPKKSRLRRLGLIKTLVGHFLLDLWRSNIAVIGVILRANRRPVRSGFVAMEIGLADENALALLAYMITVTPGTSWVAFDRKTRMLIIHVLDLDNDENATDLIKTRYEAPLKAIFA